MYIEKLRYFQNRYKEEELLSGLITQSINGLPVGSPCLAFLPCGPKETKAKSNIWAARRIVNETQDLNNINEQLRSLIDKFQLIFLFGVTGAVTDTEEAPTESTTGDRHGRVHFKVKTNNVNPDHMDLSSRVTKFYYTGEKPLIYDIHRFISLHEVDRIVDNLETFPDELNVALKTNRFLNYTYYDIKRSNVNEVIDNITEIIRSLASGYQNSTSFYYCEEHKGRGSRVLVDVVSISFYKLADVVPIFNHRKLEGVCMEIFLTNSELKEKAVLEQNKFLTVRFLFTKHRENVFSIDGEPVKRPYDKTVAHTTKVLFKFLKAEVPNDAIKGNKEKSKQKGKPKQKEVGEG